MNNNQPGDTPLVMSYLGLRRAIGIIGIGLPIVLAIGMWGIESSISSYYYTRMGDVFVGAMCATGVFFLSYLGYDRRDRIAGLLACGFAIGIALFPTAPECVPAGAHCILTQAQIYADIAHHTSAALYFATLAYFALCLFRKTDPSKTPTPQKLQRNRVYTVCGWTIIIAIALVPAANALLDEAMKATLHPVFWFESTAVLAFGSSWLVKGEAILADTVEEQGSLEL